MIVRVTGRNDVDLFDLSGEVAVHDFEVGLASAGARFDDFKDIYDFGCGCGRVLRWLPSRTSAHLHASDIDDAAIDWLRANMPSVDLRQTGTRPPLPWADGAFDLVIGYSVFTHLDEDYQDAWLTELQRVTRPGAVLLLTVSGEYTWRWTMVRSGHPKVEELRALRGELDATGFLHWRGDGWEAHFPDCYHTSFHLPGYIRSHWSRWFTVIDVIDRGARPAQDLVVLRRS